MQSVGHEAAAHRASESTVFWPMLLKGVASPLRSMILLLLGLLLLTGAPATARGAVAGDLDSSFGTGGKLTTDFGSGQSDEAWALAVQDDGKLVAGGASSGDFGLARYNPSGTLDISFGVGGTVRTDLGSAFDLVRGVALQSDGKVVAAGTRCDGQGCLFALARYNTDGSLDASFGSGGKVVTDLAGSNEQINSVAIQDDGRIVVAGSEYNASEGAYDFALARYEGDGSLDPTFGTAGSLTTDFGPSTADIAFAVKIQSDGGVVAAGSYEDLETSGIKYVALARYTASGALDRASAGRVRCSGTSAAERTTVERSRSKAMAPSWSQGDQPGPRNPRN